MIERYLPSRRTIQKFGRDAIIAGIAAVAVFIADNQADLGLPAEVGALITAGALFIYREIRGILGGEPEE